MSNAIRCIDQRFAFKNSILVCVSGLAGLEDGSASSQDSTPLFQTCVSGVFTVLADVQ